MNDAPESIAAARDATHLQGVLHLIVGDLSIMKERVLAQYILRQKNHTLSDAEAKEGFIEVMVYDKVIKHFETRARGGVDTDGKE